MADRIPLARPSIGQAELAAAERTLRGGHISGGPAIETFERRLAELVGGRPVAVVASGTAAIELALEVFGVGAGQRVLVTAFGFPAAASALRRIGAEPVAVDVDAEQWLTRWDQASEHADRATLMIAIDQLGAATDSAAVAAFTAETGVPVMVDAACGLGAVDASGSPGGACGEMATLSFHARKLVTTGEGGAVVCRDGAQRDRLVALRNHGQIAAGRFAEAGTNARLSALAAAIGSAQVERVPKMLAERRLLGAGYRERLADLRDAERLSWQSTPADAHAFQSFAVLLAERFDRAGVIAALDERDIEVGPATYAFPSLPHLGGADGAARAPQADLLHRQGLSLPIYCGMRSAELDRVALALSEVLS